MQTDRDPFTYSVTFCNCWKEHCEDSYSREHHEDFICIFTQSLVRILDRRARGPSDESVQSVYYHREMSKLEYSRFRFAQGIDHHGSMNCNAKIMNRYLDAQAYSFFRILGPT
ncbi:hypothetical protein CDL15_Pgr003952 [Punica granatum]|uniref:Uncharacterized protein n=1 Tax=Punica granatum TaxID=22663 RepID=A0A218WPP7_PUNGR|nr:hypothetical protein CDL15_Pgr003952 [Punica granatum]